MSSKYSDEKDSVSDDELEVANDEQSVTGDEQTMADAEQPVPEASETPANEPWKSDTDAQASGNEQPDSLSDVEASLSAARHSLSEAEATMANGEEALSDEEQELKQEVERSEAALEKLEDELAGIDAELAALLEQNHKYELVAGIKRSLEELDNLGANELFWDEGSAPEYRADRLRYVQRKIDGFGEQIADVQARREALVDKIGNQNNVLDVLHYDLQDAMEREEARRDEWLVERELDDLPYRPQVMPWASVGEEDKRLKKSLGSSVTASLLFAILVSLVAIPVLEKDEPAELPERMAKLVRQERTPPPEPVVAEQAPQPEETPEPEKELVEELVPDAAKQEVVAEQPVQPDTREKVKSKGILAFRDKFASAADERPAAQLGSQARFNSAGENSVGRPERMMVTTSAPGSSGGINLSDISRDTGGGGGDMAGVALTRVSSSIGGGDGPDRPLASGAAAGRTDEEIQIVFDRYKASLYRLYNRALRNDPTLRGQMVLRLTIEPDGSVSFIELQASDMDAPVLGDQIVERVRAFDFGAKEDIVAITIIYPIDFLPAG